MDAQRAIRSVYRWIGAVWVLSLVPMAAAGPACGAGASACAAGRSCHARFSRLGPGGPIRLVAVALESDAASQRPRTWLGVRLAPLPDALKAHLGRDGIMVANIVVDSPADQANLERYDVIVAFNGQDVRSFADLQAALEKVEPGQDVTLRIIRQGQEQTLHLRPAERPQRGFELKFKYEEPQAERDFLRYFGGRLRLGPGGTWEFEPLGRLRDLLPRELEDEDVPQELREQLEELRERLREEGENLRETMRELREKLRDWRGQDWGGGWPGLGFWRGFESDRDEDAFEQEHLNLRLELRDDEHIVVEKDDEGWHVVREDQSGERKAADYDSLEALRKADPETYKLIRRHVRIGDGAFMFRWPEIHRLPGLQREFEKEFRESIRKRHWRREREGHGDRERPERSGRRTRVMRDGSGQQIFIVQRDGGRIQVRVLEEGQAPKTYTFKSLDALREKLPEVYEQARELFENDED